MARGDDEIDGIIVPEDLRVGTYTTFGSRGFYKGRELEGIAVDRSNMSKITITNLGGGWGLMDCSGNRCAWFAGDVLEMDGSQFRAKTFQVLGNGYARDSQHLWYHTKLLCTGAHLDTFELLDGGWSRISKQRKYFLRGTEADDPRACPYYKADDPYALERFTGTRGGTGNHDNVDGVLRPEDQLLGDYTLSHGKAFYKGQVLT